jgi:transmembrane sensor
MSELDRLIDEATRWIVLVNSGQASVAEQQAFRDWRALDPRHEHLCSRLETTLGVLQVPAAQGVDSDLLRRTLAAPSSRRKLLRQTLLFGGLAVSAGALGSRALPVDSLVADLRTGTGERRTVALQDGSRLTLNARSAVDIAFDERQRRLHLRSGEILVRVAEAPARPSVSRPFVARPFIVDTPFGEATALGRDLLLRHGDDGSHAFSLASPLALQARDGSKLTMAAGEQVHFGRQGFGPVMPSQGTESAWIDGLLEVRDRPLREVIEALRPYRSGVVRVDPDIARLRVSGLFRLDDSELMLEALVRTLPIRVSRLTDFWITLEAA